MTLLQQAGAAVILLLVTLSLQCGGAATLILWIEAFQERVRRYGCFAARRSLCRPR